MKKYRDFFRTAAALILLSGILYYFHYRLFGDFRNTMYYTFLDISFIPVNVLIVTLVFDNILERKQKNKILEKLNMLIALFFNEVGRVLLEMLSKGDAGSVGLIDNFDDLRNVKKMIVRHKYCFDIHKIDIEELYRILSVNKSLIVSLIGNENLLEHESFSELLMAIIHLTDEMGFRKDNGITQDDLEHLEGDVLRVYKYLTYEWVEYLDHLKDNYPYLYSSAIKTNPFK